ncbi:MAG: L-aspartate oxidase [Planctomycetota bacterium]|jgi:L-aspartate oxidase
MSPCVDHHGPSCPRFLVGFDLRRRPSLRADVLVVGSGVAGFSAALAAADAGREVTLLTKGSLKESATHYAQGGIAAVLDASRRSLDDSIEHHINDTITAGAGLCDQAIVRDLLNDGDAAIRFLERHGSRFDGADNQPDLTREGGHSMRRILHAHGDGTGREIAGTLAAAVRAHPDITVIEQAFAIDLVTDNGSVCGLVYHRRGEFYGALAGSVILASGGCGQVYRESTNPAVATGDGLAMAYRAGATVVDCEFMQFHPTTLYVAGGARMLITEAMRGEGARLLNHAGEAFMTRYDERGDLAPRDVVSQSIIAEIRSSDFSHVWLDATHLGDHFLRERFPAVHQACAELNIDISKEWIPVHPSAHYHCGGVRTDRHGQSDLPGLFACGEVAATGLHGANRLASNSLLEGVIMGQRSGLAAANCGTYPGRIRVVARREQAAPADLDVADLTRSLRAMMWRQVGIERHASGLATAERSIRFWLDHQARGFFPDESGWELQNQLLVSALISTAAARRCGSIGTHLRKDDDGSSDHRHYGYRRDHEDHA